MKKYKIYFAIILLPYWNKSNIFFMLKAKKGLVSEDDCWFLFTVAFQHTLLNKLLKYKWCDCVDTKKQVWFCLLNPEYWNDGKIQIQNSILKTMKIPPEIWFPLLWNWDKFWFFFFQQKNIMKISCDCIAANCQTFQMNTAFFPTPMGFRSKWGDMCQLRIFPLATKEMKSETLV